MKRILTALAVALSCMGMAATVYADSRHHRHDRGHHAQRHDGKHHKHPHYRHDHRGGHAHKHRSRPPVVIYHGPPPHVHHRHDRRWSRGARLPTQYRQPRYVVHDWHHRQFRRPPSGHQWVRVGTDYLLVGIATGIILEAVLNR